MFAAPRIRRTPSPTACIKARRRSRWKAWLGTGGTTPMSPAGF